MCIPQNSIEETKMKMDDDLYLHNHDQYFIIDSSEEENIDEIKDHLIQKLRAEIKFYDKVNQAFDMVGKFVFALSLIVLCWLIGIFSRKFH